MCTCTSYYSLCLSYNVTVPPITHRGHHIIAALREIARFPFKSGCMSCIIGVGAALTVQSAHSWKPVSFRLLQTVWEPLNRPFIAEVKGHRNRFYKENATFTSKCGCVPFRMQEQEVAFSLICTKTQIIQNLEEAGLARDGWWAEKHHQKPSSSHGCED